MKDDEAGMRIIDNRDKKHVDLPGFPDSGDPLDTPPLNIRPEVQGTDAPVATPPNRENPTPSKPHEEDGAETP
jgi:hypothetical protein